MLSTGAEASAAMQRAARIAARIDRRRREDGERGAGLVNELLLGQTLEFRLRARVLEEAGDVGLHRGAEHADRLGLLLGVLPVDEQVLADVEVRLAEPLALHARIGILGGIDDALGGGLAEEEIYDRPGPLREVELGRRGLEHLLVGVAAPRLREVERDDPIRLGGIELNGADEIWNGGDVEALIEASEAAVVEGQRVVRIEIDRLAVVLDGPIVAPHVLKGARAVVEGQR